jgi:hypothetical protein
LCDSSHDLEGVDAAEGLRGVRAGGEFRNGIVFRNGKTGLNRCSLGFYGNALDWFHIGKMLSQDGHGAKLRLPVHVQSLSMGVPSLALEVITEEYLLY